MAQYRGISSERMDLIAKALLEVSELDQDYDKLCFYSEEDIPYHYYTLDEGEITLARAESFIAGGFTAEDVDVLPSPLVADIVYRIKEGVSFRQALLMTEPIPQGGGT